MSKLTQDKVLDVLRGTGRGKRARRFSTLNVYMRGERGYSIETGGRVVEESTDGTKEDAMKSAEERAVRLRDITGQAVVVNIY